MAKKRVFGGVNDIDEDTDKFFESGGKAMEQEPAPEKEAPVSAAEPKAKAIEDKKPEAPAADESDAPKGEQKVDKLNPEKKEEFVPHGAFHEERERRKRVEGEFKAFKAAQEEQQKKLQERLDALYEKAKPQAPDPSQDPAGYLNHKLTAAEQKLAELEQFRQSTTQQQQQMLQQQQFINAYQNAAYEFTQQKPDFNDAYAHLMKERIDDIVNLGYPRQQAAMIAQQEEAAIVAKSFQDGVNPAERLYGLAVRRGYNAQKEAPNAGAEKLKTIEKGQKSNPDSASNSQGKPKLTLEAIANMPDDEFAKLDWDKVRELAA